MEVEWTNHSTTFAPFMKVRKDKPLMVAKYILHHNDLKRHSHWACSTICNMKRAIRWLHCLYSPSSSAHAALSLETWSAMPAYACICCNSTITQPPQSSNGKPKKKCKTKKNNNKHLGKIKYGVHVPCTVKEALRFDEENGNTHWADAISKEMDTLHKLNCFHVAPNNWNW